MDTVGAFILAWRLFKVSAASMSSADMPERTLAALWVRSSPALIVSTFVELT